MRIEDEPKFLVLHSVSGPGLNRLEIVSTFSEALVRWTPGTRLSPIWPVEGFALNLSGQFEEEQQVLFLGPVRPARPGDQLVALREPGAVELWLSAGCFNFIARAPIVNGSAPALDELERWALGEKIPHERWTLHKGAVVHAHSWTNDASAAAPALRELARLSEANIAPGLAPTLQEFLAVQASTLTRSAAMAPDLHRDFVALGETATKLLDAYAAGSLNAIDLNSRLVSLNAALSRTSSQAFSGIPPIAGTECHFWIHSLLGTGAANMALARVSQWIQGVLGEERIPERIRALALVRDDVPDLNTMRKDPSLPDRNFLHAGQVAPDERGRIYPLVTYFSGRDGFSSHLQTLSAPISTLSECNSYRSSLMTISHEITHVIIHAVLPAIYPDHTDPKALREVGEMMLRDYHPATLLAAARKLMVESLVGMEQAPEDKNAKVADLKAAIPDILKNWRLEAQETLVHTFDFMYFYAGDTDFYIESIWHSWSAIPGISDRIAGYVMRTLCAISANLLNNPSATRLLAAVRAMRTVLSRLKADGGLMSDYVDQALHYLAEAEKDQTRWKRLTREYTARLDLVRLVQLFLYSNDLAARLYDDPYVRAGGKPTGGKQSLAYDLSPVGNPITFLRDTLKQDPVPAESIWVLHSLAFDLRNAQLGSSHAGS